MQKSVAIVIAGVATVGVLGVGVAAAGGFRSASSAAATTNASTTSKSQAATPAPSASTSIKGQTFGKSLNGLNAAPAIRGFGRRGGGADDAVMGLVSRGTITRAQATAAVTAVFPAERAAMQANTKTVLAGLVAKGTITQAEANAYLAGAGPFADDSHFGNSTITQAHASTIRQALATGAAAQASATAKTALTPLVAKGAITQTQADAIASAIASNPRFAGPGFGGPGNGGRDDHNGN